MDAAFVGSVFMWVAAGLAALATLPRFSRLLGAAAGSGAVSTLVLGLALLINDFALAYVAETSSLQTPWPYRLAALWGGMEGSMLFYASMTTVVAWIGLRKRRSAPLGAALCALLLVFTGLFSNPFTRLDIPAVDGNGLLALLQHPAMIYHPPILYLGLTTLVVPFAMTVTAAARRQSGDLWLNSVRRSLLISWTLLTFGMVAGANWAYVELGWGGFWAWDPVENTALMPWLATTVFLHVSRVYERDGRLRRWTVAFGALPFALTVLGVYLTRSGSTGSIHAFAEDPVIGRILLVAALATVLVVAFVAHRTPKGEPWERIGLGRDTWLVASGVLVVAALIFVTIGSAYPAYVSVFAGDEVAVGSRFFVSTVYPLTLVMVPLMGLAFSTTWSGMATTKSEINTFVLVFVVAAGIALAVAVRRLAPIALIALAISALVALVRSLATRRPKRRILAGHMAHVGLVMVLIGAAGSSLGDQFEGAMRPGQEVEVAGKTVRLEAISTGEDDRFIFVRATFDVDGAAAEPEIRAYEDQSLPVAEPALVTDPLGDVVIAISTVTPDASEVDVSVFVRPMVWWVWAGALVVGLGGMVSLSSTTAAAEARRPEARAGQRSEGTAI
ncbi:MAG: cytochrome c-type biogenesis CcmF C-terminal domain-containing protein [Acidimicrobiia bacterium]|nr:cytochrome c-type biogenesis CcmF C-terminal domain-containing protein [Acidimicrobiia bacterium]